MALGAVALWAALPASSQPAPGQHRIGFVNVGPAAPLARNVEAFKAGLEELGYVEGKNLTIDFRWADGKPERLPTLIGQLLALKPRVIVSTGGPVTARAAKAATTSVPIVFISGNPVDEGLVGNLAKPGGNLTGLAVLASDLEQKRIELLSLIAPNAKRVAIIWNPEEPRAKTFLANTEEAARRLGMTPLAFSARNGVELDAVFAEIVKWRAEALFVTADPVLGFLRSRIVQFASGNRLPGIYFWREFAHEGGLASYGTNLSAVYRRTAVHVDKILKGARPGDLPIEQPTTFELVVNLRTAKALGLAIPAEILNRADEVIQ